MLISEDQLILWSKQGDTSAARHTYQMIHQILTSETSRIKTGDFELYLQGSYLNDTNIGEDCDVDVVVQLKERRLDLLPEFKEELRTALSHFFGMEHVEVGRRALKVSSEAGEPIADVLACCPYRWSDQASSQVSHPAFAAEGIQFLTTKGEREIRFPKIHHQNGVGKDWRTDGHYKKWIRIFKNARLHLSNPKFARKRAGSSYLLECLLYNVPDSKFRGDFQTSYLEIINWLQQADLSQFVCQHEQHALFGSDPGQWKIKKAQKMIRAFAELWHG